MSWLRFRPVRRLLRERAAMLSLVIIAVYALVAVFGAVGGFEAVGADPQQPVVTEPQDIAFYSEPSDDKWTRWLGTDRQGRSILVRALASIQVAMAVGVVAGFSAVLIGGVLGCLAGFFRGRVDDFIVWLYSTMESIPYLLLLLVLSYSAAHVFGKGIITVHVAFAATFWVGPCRVIRGEIIKLRESEYVTAARALGASSSRILLRHLVPNVLHLVFIYFSLTFIGAIKSEVILSFLGLGVKDQPSWGIMIDQSRAELATDFYWQIGAATAFMFVLVLAFNIFTDAIQDALDPQAIGRGTTGA